MKSKLTMANAKDLTTDFEPYINNVNGQPVMAKCMTGRFTITNSDGAERSGDKGDWLVQDDDGTLRVCWPEVFAGNYKRRKKMKRTPDQKGLCEDIIIGSQYQIRDETNTPIGDKRLFESGTKVTVTGRCKQQPMNCLNVSASLIAIEERPYAFSPNWIIDCSQCSFHSPGARPEGNYKEDYGDRGNRVQKKQMD